ncbi:vacuolar membrane protein [Ceratobasidium sp. AG-Ba]|nr:vacuolar membrane protein [Ceratobasidium sp. AG-Ba]
MIAHDRLLLTLLSTPTSTAAEPMMTDSPTLPIPIPDTDVKRCRLLGPTALVVQALMGVIVILSLVWKRNHESPRRPWRIWMFDVSKQVVGQIVVHMSNVFISDLVAHHSSNNPCTLYFLNVLVDTTVGVAFIYAFLHAGTWLLATKLHLKGFKSGDYGGIPPSKIYWVKQATVYVTSLILMKLAVVALFAIWPGLFPIGDWLLSWTDGDAALQVIVVMGLFPIVMNVLQFWLIDSIVKLKEKAPILPTTSTDEDEEHEHLVPESYDDDDTAPNVTRRSRERSPPPTPSPVPTPPGTGYGATQGQIKGKPRRRGDLPELSDWPLDDETDNRGSAHNSAGPTSPVDRPRINSATSETWFMTSSIARPQTPDVHKRS